MSAEPQSKSDAIREFHVNVPESELAELRRRIKATRWLERETVSDSEQGVQLETMQALLLMHNARVLRRVVSL